MAPEATGRRSPHSHRVGTPFAQFGSDSAGLFQCFGTPFGRQKVFLIEPFDAPDETFRDIPHFVQIGHRGHSKVGSGQPCGRRPGTEFEIRHQGIDFPAVVRRDPKGFEHQPENRGDQGRVVFP